jgi:hypothetical protein
MERTFPVTNTWSRKLNTKGAWSAHSSRHAGLFPRSQLSSSKLSMPGSPKSSAQCLIVELGPE